MFPDLYEASDQTTKEFPLQNVLLVDDSVAQVRLLSRLLKAWGLSVTEAHSGVQALQMCRERQFDLILSDWMMPEMDGLEFCRKYRALPDQRFGYFILLTSKNKREEVALGLDAGADDFATKPVETSELRARINAGARIVMMERELTQKNALIAKTLNELQRVHDMIDQDLRQARKIQQSLMPERSMQIGSGRISLLLKPCGHVGGDLSGMFSPGDATAGFYNVDVSGHGITSAMMTARVAGHLNGRFPEQNIALNRREEGGFELSTPKDVAVRLNQRLSQDPGVEEYMTMVYATADMTTGHTRFVQAGHPPPLLISKDGSCRFVGQGGMPVGLFAEAEYSEDEVALQPGDKLLIYSDGITEMQLGNAALLDQDGLVDLIAQLPKGLQGTDFLDALYERLCSLRGVEQEAEDDVSAALLEFLPGEAVISL